MSELRKRAAAGSAAPPAPQSRARDAAPPKSGGFSVLRVLGWALGAVAAAAASLVAWLVYSNGGVGGAPFPDYFPQMGAPLLPESAIEVVATLPSPPGNLAVDKAGRVFFTFHPQYRFPVKVAEWLPADARWVPFPQDQSIFSSVLSVRERDGTLYALDYADFGVSGTPSMVALDTATASVKWRFEFKWIAGFGSMLNDFVISPDGRHIYIADTSVLRGRPALIVLDTVERKAAVALHSHPSLDALNVVLALKDGPTANKTLQLFGGLLKVRPAVDSIALSTDGRTLFYSAVADTSLYSVPTAALRGVREGTNTNDEVAAAVNVVTSKKTSSDGLTTDVDDNVFVSDFVNSAVNVYPTRGERKPYVLLRSPELLRWPDGFSFGPGNHLYISCSCLQYDMAGLDYKEFAPFHILRVKLGVGGTIGM
ncbi:hypothetical protein DFJ74DRAFT_710684 [Hyaloraphidium curvatum]|nr:hypothetical protein DFJ74DRAFT_710684 [Hyaloraphidium curvatum]